MLPDLFVPEPNSQAVQLLRAALKVNATAVRVPVVTDPGARERNCHINVRDRIERDGGRMQLGWAVCQHSNFFIEGEPHAVFDPGNGTWIDCTPHTFPEGTECVEILFIPDRESFYDPATDEVKDNVRVPLVNDPRVSEALELFSKITFLMNSVPGFDVQLPQATAQQVVRLKLRASALLSQFVADRDEQLTRARKIGRNDPCPCGSGKKYKKCHGA
jgi:uncharacterized Fe-S cluster protein YjdI